MEREYSYERFAAIRRYGSFGFLSDCDWIIYVCDASGQFNIWRQRSCVGEDAFQPCQLTSFLDDTVRKLYTSKVDDAIIFFADKNGDEY